MACAQRDQSARLHAAAVGVLSCVGYAHPAHVHARRQQPDLAVLHQPWLCKAPGHLVGGLLCARQYRRVALHMGRGALDGPEAKPGVAVLGERAAGEEEEVVWDQWGCCCYYGAVACRRSRCGRPRWRDCGVDWEGVR